MCLLGNGLVISHLKDSDGREEKEKKKKKRIGLLFYRWTSLGMSLFKVYPTKYCFNLIVRRPQVGVKILRQVEA